MRIKFTIIVLLICIKALLLGSVAVAGKASVSAGSFGKLADGTPVSVYTLTNPNGIEAKITNYCGIILSLKVPDKNGKLGDIVLGYDNLKSYLQNSPYFGALIGRYGNRIAKGKFTIDKQTYNLATNNGPNHLHGGNVGFDKKVWDATPFQKGSDVGLKMKLISEDGDEGYPGTLTVDFTYTLMAKNQLQLNFQATTDKATHVNLTQHTYFNLAGRGDILDHRLFLNANWYTPVNKTLIPTGEIRSVVDTPFDFRSLMPIGARIDENHEQLKFGRGYDHNFLLRRKTPDGEALAARVIESKSGRVLEIRSTEPAIQFYSGNFLDGSNKGKGRVYKYRNGFCLEPQHSPDSPNQIHFPSTLLRPGETYSHKMSYTFLTTNYEFKNE